MAKLENIIRAAMHLERLNWRNRCISWPLVLVVYRRLLWHLRYACRDPIFC